MKKYKNCMLKGLNPQLRTYQSVAIMPDFLSYYSWHQCSVDLVNKTQSARKFFYATCKIAKINKINFNHLMQRTNDVLIEESQFICLIKSKHLYFLVHPKKQLNIKRLKINYINKRLQKLLCGTKFWFKQIISHLQNFIRTY